MSKSGPDLIDFLGSWVLKRVIDDKLTRQTSHFVGKAVIERTESGASYFESGNLVVPGTKPMAATRRYIWSQTPHGIAVFFDDGQTFHSFDPSKMDVMAKHWCAPDSYNVEYDFSGWPHWSSRWSVDGPRKSYVMESRYWRG